MVQPISTMSKAEKSQVTDHIFEQYGRIALRKVSIPKNLGNIDVSIEDGGMIFSAKAPKKPKKSSRTNR